MTIQSAKESLFAAISAAQSGIADAQQSIAHIESAISDLDALSPVDPNTGVVWKLGSAPGGSWHAADWSPTLSMGAAAASFSSIITSIDGKNWTIASAPTAEYKGMKAGGGVFIAVSKAGPVVRSVDGINWSSHSAANLGQWHDITYSPSLNRFVAVAQGGGTEQTIMYSDDGGQTWVGVNSPNSNSWQGITWGRSEFVAVAETGSHPDTAISSPDGITWTGHQAPDHNWKDIDWSEDLQQYAASASTGQIMSGPDPDSMIVKITGSNNYHGIEWGGGMWIAVGQSSGQNIMRSLDGETWTELPSHNINCQSPMWMEALNRWSCVGLSGVMYSPDETTPPRNVVFADEGTPQGNTGTPDWGAIPTPNPETNRYLLVEVQWGLNNRIGEITSLDCNGAATKLHEFQDNPPGGSPGDGAILSYWWVKDEVSTSVNVSAIGTTPGNNRGSVCRVYEMFGLNSPPVLADFSNSPGGIMSIDVPAGGLVFGATHCNNGASGTITWTELVKDGNEVTTGTDDDTGVASGLYATAQIGLPVTVQNSAANWVISACISIGPD